MELKEIEHKIACHELNASQVFTQMMQHVKRGAPCERQCESKVFEIEIRRLKKQCEDYALAEHEADHDRQKAWDYAEELKAEIARLKAL